MGIRARYIALLEGDYCLMDTDISDLVETLTRDHHQPGYEGHNSLGKVHSHADDMSDNFRNCQDQNSQDAT